MVTDSVACLTKQFADQYGIDIIPISFMAGGKFYRDWIDITPTEAYKLFLEDPDSFNTSAPSPEECYQVYRKAAQKAPDILCVTVSKKLSRVYDSAIDAIELMQEEIPGVNVKVVDSMQATSSEGMIALAAARAAADGKDLNAVTHTAEEVRGKVGAVAFLDTIKYVYRSGRIPRIASQLGTVLNIRPVLTVSEVVHFNSMVRSRKKGIERMVQVMRGKVNDRPVRAAVTHAYAPEEAELLKERVMEEFNCIEIWLSEFSPVMGYACGTGTIGLSFYPED